MPLKTVTKLGVFSIIPNYLIPLFRKNVAQSDKIFPISPVCIIFASAETYANETPTTMITITDTRLREAAQEGMDTFLAIFTDAYREAMEGEPTARTMQMLNAEQHTLLAYVILRDELMEGGFCQLIQNGYGGYIFDNPFARAMRLWGVTELSKLIYAAKKIFDAHRTDLERERTDDEFMAMYEQYEAFDELEEEFLDKEELFTAQVATYVDEHIDLFAHIEEP